MTCFKEPTTSQATGTAAGHQEGRSSLLIVDLVSTLEDVQHLPCTFSTEKVCPFLLEGKEFLLRDVLM